MAVYFIQQDGGERLIKIGYSIKPKSRVKHLQTAAGYPLIFLGVIKYGSLRDEHELHRRFESDRVYGEWFRPSSDLIEYITKHASGEATPASEIISLWPPSWVKYMKRNKEEVPEMSSREYLLKDSKHGTFGIICAACGYFALMLFIAPRPEHIADVTVSYAYAALLVVFVLSMYFYYKS